nr:ribosomal protein S4 [Podocarpus macrophyllus]
MPALRSKTCRLPLGNVWNKKLTEIQRRIPQRLRSKRRYNRKNVSLRQNLNSYPKLQAIRKLSLFHGNPPIKGMPHFPINRGAERASYIPFLLNPETRSDVIPVRLHSCETLPQARQLISHRKIRVNNEMVNMTRFQVSHGDSIPIEENYVETMGRKVRKSFYIERFVNRIVGKKKLNYYPEGVMWRRIQTRWFRLLEKRQGCHLSLKSLFLRLNNKKRQLRSNNDERQLRQFRWWRQEQRWQRNRWRWVRRQWRDWWRRFQRQEQKFLESRVSRKGVYLGRFFAEHNGMKRDFYYSVHLLLKRRNGIWDLPTRSLLIPNNNNFSSDLPYYCFEFPYCGTRKRRIGGIQLPTHYSEVNHRTPKAVVSYGPDIGHIPHNIRLKDLNLPR